MGVTLQVSHQPIDTLGFISNRIDIFVAYSLPDGIRSNLRNDAWALGF